MAPISIKKYICIVPTGGVTEVPGGDERGACLPKFVPWAHSFITTFRHFRHEKGLLFFSRPLIQACTFFPPVAFRFAVDTMFQNHFWVSFLRGVFMGPLLVPLGLRGLTFENISCFLVLPTVLLLEVKPAVSFSCVPSYSVLSRSC